MLLAGNTTNLSNHLRLAHPELKLGDDKPGEQPKINAFVINKTSNIPLPAAKIQEIDTSVKKFVIETLTPLSMTEKPAFKNMLATLEPRYTPPTAKTLTKKLTADFDTMKTEIKEELSFCQNVAITHDSWTSVATENYEAVTCHYFTQDCTSKISGSQDAQNIGEFLMGVKASWGLCNIIAVSDNASVEVKTF